MSRRSLLAAALVPGLALACGAVMGPASAAAPAAPTTTSPAATTDGSGYTEQDLATAGVGSPWYRIPALATTTKGTVIAAYDARPTLGDLPSHITMVVRRSTDNGRTWQAQQIVREDPAPHGYGDPSLVVDHQTGRIFLFYAAGMNQGFAGSHTGNDETDPDILQADYSYSDDDGLTWHHRRITHEIKDPSWGGFFASSGKGIQVKRGKYAGRLVQQYAVLVGGQIYAFSAYSDDHGATWHHGKLVGPGMDENKVVELADGRLMLNSRSRSGYRKVAYSTDGGETWSQPVDDHELPDPADNGSILRENRNAGANSPEAHKLLFSNNESQSARENLVVKQSCDDGQTWPIRKVVEPGFAAYSTLERLPNGDFGLLWESNDYRNITFSTFTPDWLNGVCAPLQVTVPDNIAVGATTDVEVTVTNQAPSTVAGRVSLDLPQGWSAPAVSVPRLASGGSTTVSVPVTVPSDAIADGYTYRAVFHTNKGESQARGSIKVPVGNGPQTVIPKDRYSIASVDSQELVGEDGAATNAIDGDPSTKWHTRWYDQVDPMPHQITVDLGAEHPVAGLRYLPRQDSATNGDIADFTVEASSDGQQFHQVFAGTFSGSKSEKELTFDPTQARYVRLTARKAVNGKQFAAAAELTVLEQR